MSLTDLDPRAALSVAGREFYREHLAYGGPGETTRGPQRQLAELMGRLSRDPRFDRRELRGLLKEARGLGEAFGFMLARYGQ